MAAINIHIGTQEPEDHVEGSAADLIAKDKNKLQGLGDLAGPRSEVPSLVATHNGLSRMLWIRRALEDILSEREYWLEGDHLYLDKPFKREDLPWYGSAMDVVQRIALFGEAAKMACPTWDLPAGASSIGGTCPGATAGQTVAGNIAERHKLALYTGGEVRPQETVCQICYAEGGNYSSPHVQLGEILRYHWAKEMTSTEEGRAEWIEAMVATIGRLCWSSERLHDPNTKAPVRPIRVHSSGDFFSHEYAEAWIEIANRTPSVRYWAPTRTWAAAGWSKAWPGILAKMKHNNFIVRPSAYHTNDPAPGRDFQPWLKGPKQANLPYPFTCGGKPVMGTTSIYQFDDEGRGVDPRYDWDCRTYAIGKSEPSCREAEAPDGQEGCRACWLRPDLRVNYTTH